MSTVFFNDITTNPVKNNEGRQPSLASSFFFICMDRINPKFISRQFQSALGSPAKSLTSALPLVSAYHHAAIR